MKPGSSPLLLAIDSSTSTGAVAIGRGGRVLAEVSLDVRSAHSSSLLPAIDFALRAAGSTPSELGAIAVGGGPGSFTGLRIAAATAKGIAHARGLPLYSYSGLMAAAAQAWAADGPVCALFDARGRDVYLGCYAFWPRVDVLLSPAAWTLDEVIEHFRDRPPLFTGEGALRHRPELEDRLGARIADAAFAVPRAAALVWLVERAPELGRVPDPLAWQPEYLRASGAERIAAGRATGREGSGS